MRVIILIINLLVLTFSGIVRTNAQTATDSLTELINKEKDLSKKNALYLERALSYSVSQKDQAYLEIKNAEKFFQNQKNQKGVIDAILTLSDHYFLLQNYSEAAKTDSVALRSLKKTDYTKGDARAYGNLGRDILALGDYQGSKVHLQKAIQLQESFKPIDYAVVAELYNKLSVISSENGQIAESFKNIEKAVELAEKVDDKALLLRLYLNKAINYTRISKYELSTQNNLKAVELAQEINDDTNLLKAYNNLAITFKHLKEYDKAIIYHKKGIKLAEKIQNYRSLGLSLMNIATVYVLNGQMEDLDTLYLASIDNFRKINNHNSLAMAYHNYGNYFIHKNEPDKAEENLMIALNLRRKYSSPPLIASSLAVLGEQMIKKNNLELAEKYLLEAEQIMEGRKENRILNEIYAYLKNLYAAKRNFKKAFDYQQKEIILKNELFNENEKLNALKVQTQYDLEKQELEHQLVEQQQQQRQIYLVSIAAFVIIVLLMVLIIFWQRRIRIRQNHQSEIAQMQHIHKINLAKSLAKTEQTERKKIAEKLHDETVGILSIAKLNVEQLSEELFIAESDAGKKLETAKKLLNEASDSIRGISHSLMPIALDKYGLKSAIEELVNSINTSETLNVECVIEGLENSKSWDSQLNLTIFRMVQEVFNNIIKHAQATHVLLQIMELEESITIFIEDNGKGFELNETESEGIGLSLLKQNIEYLNGKVEINGGQNTGTFVLAEIPIF